MSASGGEAAEEDGGAQPDRDQKTIVVSRAAYVEVTRRAQQEGRARKAVASDAILAGVTSKDLLEDLPRAKAKGYRAAVLYLGELVFELEAGRCEVSVEEFVQLMHAIEELERIEPGRSVRGPVLRPFDDGFSVCARAEHEPGASVVVGSGSEHAIQLSGEPRGCDFYRFAREVLGYRKLAEDPHHAWCRELDRRHKRSLWLEPRHTYKSTIFTKSYPIWRLLGDPNLRILLVNATAGNAEAFLGEITSQYLTNERLVALYERSYGVKPLTPRSAKRDSIVLTTRSTHYSEPSIRAVGALSNQVSTHYDLIIVDDLCNIDDRESAAVREKKKRWFRHLISVLTPDGELVVVGTHWHFDDVYSFIITEQNPKLPEGARYYIQRESCYAADKVRSRFPGIYTAEKLEALKVEKGKLLFACQYLNRPIPEEDQVFKLEALHTVPRSEIDEAQAEAYAFCDPSLGAKDYSAIVTVVKQKGSWIVVHCNLSRAAHSKLIQKLIRLQKIFNYKQVGIEANSLGKARYDRDPCSFELVLKREQREARVSIPYKLVWQTAQKRTRIQSIEPFYTNGQLQFLDDWSQAYPELVEQLIHFPLAAHDDGPDALAGVIDLIRSKETAERRQVLIPRAR